MLVTAHHGDNATHLRLGGRSGVDAVASWVEDTSGPHLTEWHLVLCLPNLTIPIKFTPTLWDMSLRGAPCPVCGLELLSAAGELPPMLLRQEREHRPST